VEQLHPPACRQLCSSKPYTQVLLLLVVVVVTIPLRLWWQVAMPQRQR
jgi:hypothetical protein